MKKTLMTLAACAAMFVIPAQADPTAFRTIVGDAANLQKDAEMLRRDLKVKSIDASKVKGDVDNMRKHIDALREHVQKIDATAASFSGQQQKDWEMIKTKVEILTIFHDRKADMLNAGEFSKNRAMLRAHAEGIAKRAQMLQETASKFDR